MLRKEMGVAEAFPALPVLESASFPTHTEPLYRAARESIIVTAPVPDTRDDE